MIELACITDTAFARHTAAMLHSALTRSPGARFAIYVLHDGPLDATAAAGLRAVAQGHAAALQFIEPPPALAAQFATGYFPRSVWLRVLLPDLLPGTARVLYLDSDLIVADSLRPLWDTDLRGNLLGAVTNPFYPFMPDHPAKLGIGRRQDYFNSGMLLMDLERMRAEGLVADCIDFARSHPGADYPDQDCLNQLCRDRWLHLHPRWNVQSPYFELPPRQLPLPRAQVLEALAQPAIIHYIGPFKPWQYLCRHPRQALYFEHARATPWGEPELQGRNLRNAVMRRLPLAWIDRWLRAERRMARLWRGAPADVS